MENIIEINDSIIITNIVNKAFMTVAQQYNFTKENAPSFPGFIDHDVIENQIKNGLKMYGYNMNNQIVGCIGYSYYKEQTYFIERLATLPEYRHLGIGKKMMGFIENKIIENDGKIAEIHVVDINEILVEWYKKMNYKKVRIDKLFDGERKLPFNGYVMNKELEE